jgi:curli biogenesis system outer membrane secretion channel CsgG
MIKTFFKKCLTVGLVFFFINIVTYAALIISEALPSQQAIKPRIAIKTLENPSILLDSTIGNSLTEIMITELQKTGTFSIVERQLVDELLSEIRFGETEWAKSESFASKGHLLGAEYFLFGKVTNFSYKERAEDREVYVLGKGKRTVTRYIQEADVRIDFRVANTKTGEIILADAGVAKKTSESESSEMEIWQLIIRSQSIVGEWYSSLIGRTAIDATRDVVRKLNQLASELADYAAADALENQVKQLSGLEGKILGEVSSNEFVINLGTRDGLIVGDNLKVFRNTPIKNKKGEVIYVDRKELGKLEIIDTSFASDKSKVRYVSVSSETSDILKPREGDTVKVDLDHARVIRGAKSAAPPSVELLLRKGDRYMEDKHFSLALQQFQQANKLKPNDPQIISRMAKAHLYLRNFYELENILTNMIHQNIPIEIDVYHPHFLGYCSGTFLIEGERISYQPQRGDHGFQTTVKAIVQIEINEAKGGGLPSLYLKFIGTDKKEKKYNFIPVAISKIEKGQIIVDEFDREDCLKFLRLIHRVLTEYVR